MAYTGILLRGDTQPNIYNDPPIAREACMGGEFMALGTNSGVNYWLNIAALSTIGELTPGTGVVEVGIRTAALPVIFNGPGYIREDTDEMLIKGTYSWNHAALSNVKVANDTMLRIENFDVETPILSFKNSALAAITALNTLDITVSWATGDFVEIYNETTKVMLGTSNTSGTVFTFPAAQTVGDHITVRAVDGSYNKSAKTKGVIA